MSVRNKQVQPAVIVVIEESPAETQDMPSRLGDTDGVADLFENTLSVVPPDVV